MCLLEKIIYTADAVSYDRTYKGVQLLREEAFQDLDRVMFEVVQFTLKKLVKDSVPIAVDTVSCYNEFCLQKEK